jgi:hypothetical protein
VQQAWQLHTGAEWHLHEVRYVREHNRGILRKDTTVTLQRRAKYVPYKYVP